MLAVEDVLVCDSIYTVSFACRLDLCGGACCITGDDGPGAQMEEIHTIGDNLDKILPFVDQKNRNQIKEKGYYYSRDGRNFIALMPEDTSCVFSYIENKTAGCAIQRAGIKKPYSCWLFPLYLKKMDDYYYLTYRNYSECDTALNHENSVPLYVYCKEQLIAYFGKEWYKKLCYAVENAVHTES